MALSKRERTIAIVAGAAVALLVLNHFALQPLLSAGAQVSKDRANAASELEKAGLLFQRERQMNRKWSEMVSSGLKSDPAEAEAQVLHALQDWADQARLNLTSRKVERSTEGKDVREITVQTVGTGPMSAVARFLYLVQSSTLPLRIRDLQIGTRREGTDDLSVLVRISTLYLVKTAPQPPAAAPAKKTEEPA